MARTRKNPLIVGGKYDIITQKWTGENYYYTGKENDLCGAYNCDICGRELNASHIFMRPAGNASYKDCINGDFSQQLFVVEKCLKKIKIVESR